jgi:hypothetical protein
MTTKVWLRVMAGLLLANGLLFVSAQEVEARRYQRTCSVETATKQCRCYHTIIQECNDVDDCTYQCGTN